MNALEVLSLSVNQISSLKDVQYCYNLKELYLRKNLISSIHEVRYLTNLRNLRKLWLGENPIAEMHNYRLMVIQLAPQIDTLDNLQVTPDERDKAQFVEIEDSETTVWPS